MTTIVSIPNPSHSSHKVNVAQSGSPNAMSFIEPGTSLSVTLHSGNTVTLSQGDEVSTGPRLPEGA